MALLDKIGLLAPSKSNFDLSQIKRTTMAPGVLYPILVEELIAGDEIKINMDAVIKTHPTIAPVFGSFKYQIDLFFVPTRLYVPNMHFQNRAFDPTTVSFPYFNVTQMDSGTQYENKGYDIEALWGLSAYGVSRNSLENYLGLPTGFVSVDYNSRYNAIPRCGYYDIFRNYYANQQADQFRIFTAPETSESGVLTAQPHLDYWDLSGIDTALNEIKKVDGDANFSYGKYHTQPLGGLCTRSFLPDQHTAFLETTRVDGVKQKSKMVVNAESELTFDQIITSSKLYEFLNRTMLAGGRFTEWLNATFGIAPAGGLEIPEFLGSTSTYINFEDVVQTSFGLDGQNSLGDLAGRGSGRLGSRQHGFHVEEPGYLMAIASITPQIDHWQNVQPYINKTNMMDCYAPQFDCLGFQSKSLHDINAVPEVDYTKSSNTFSLFGGDPYHKAIGYQPAWTEYMTASNRLHGDFTHDLRYWTLSRNNFYSYDNETVTGVRNNPSTAVNSYIDPSEFNHIFANTALDAENFLVQVKFDIFARRPISKQVMPKL